MRRSDLVRNPSKGKAVRTSQIVFGERQHLLRVLDSVERSALPATRLDQERRVIEQLIHARTQELNRINPGWDEKVGIVLSAEVKPEALDQLSRQAPKEDYYLLRLISEHPKVAAKTLGRLSHHAYSAIRENIASGAHAQAGRKIRHAVSLCALRYRFSLNENSATEAPERVLSHASILGSSELAVMCWQGKAYPLSARYFF
jgi:hypothetical protein